MVLEIDYLNLLPKEYKKALKKLNKKLETATTFSVKNRLLQNFAEKFTTLPEIWNYWSDLIYDDATTSDKILTWNTGKIYERKLFDFPAVKFPHVEWPYYNDYISFHYYAEKGKIEELKNMISLPNSKLQLAYNAYIENNDSPPTSNELLNQYKKNSKIYQEIKKADIKNGKEFIKILLKTENIEFVINNIETRLAKNPWCQNLWKAYIEYLEDTKSDSKDLFQLYSRYCRLFLNDKKMKEKYQTKIKKMNENCEFDISEFWIDLIKFEFHFNSLKSSKTWLKKALKISMKDKMKFFYFAKDFADQHKFLKLSKKIDDAKEIYLKENPTLIDLSYKKLLKPRTCEIPEIQKLPFCIAVNLHILENLYYSHLRKLYQTSKYFYYKYQINLVHKFEIFDDTENAYPSTITKEYSGNSIKLTKNEIELMKDFKNIWLTNSLKINGNNLNISKFLSKIVKSNLKALTLNSCNLTLSECKIFFQSNSIESLCLDNVTNFYHTDVKDLITVSLTELLAFIPKLRRIVSTKRYLSAEKGHENLLSLKFDNKLELMDLRFNGNFNAEGFYKFLEKNLASNAFLNFHIINGNFEEFKNILENKFKSWDLNLKPTLSWHSNRQY